MTGGLLWLAYCVAGLLVLHVASILLAASAMTRTAPDGRQDRPGITVVRPVCGLEHHLEQTLTSTFHAEYPDYEIIFCSASATDTGIPMVQRLIADNPQTTARLLIGDDPISGNPKLNNCVKGWQAARHDLILLADSNVLLPPDCLTRLLQAWRPGTGLVSSPPIGVQPQGFWARLECAFLNSFQARWQLASARIDNGFAQGKMLLWDKAVLERAGGIAVLGREMAEDVASTKVVRAAGLKVRLPGRFFAQPIGPRRFAAVWSRQLRWARVRRLGFPIMFLPELLAGAAFPFVGLLVMVAGGLTFWAIPLGLILWYGTEYWLARIGGWPRTVADVAAWMLRDAVLPVIWVACWASSSFEWRGTVMTAKDVPDTPAAPKTGA